LYELTDLPKVAAANPDRNVFDSARLIVAKLVSEAWGLDADKVFAGVDTGKLWVSLRRAYLTIQERKGLISPLPSPVSSRVTLSKPARRSLTL